MRELNAEFIKQMAIEKKYQPMADELYKELFPNCEIETIEWEASSKNRMLQMADIDRIIHTKDNKHIKISEKFRLPNKYPLHDITIELYSNLEKRKLGWTIHSDADYLFYFKGDKVCIVDAQDLKGIAEDILKEVQNYDFEACEINKLYKHPIQIKGMEILGSIMVHQPGQQSWKTVTYMLPIKNLKNLSNKVRVRNVS